MRIPASDVICALDDAVDGIVRMAAALIEGVAPSTALCAVSLPREGRGAGRTGYAPNSAK